VSEKNGSVNAFSAMLSRARETGKAVHIIGAHDCVSARVAEQAGFGAVWVSSLGLAVVSGKCDRNELGWTETVNALEAIAESISIPVILDADEGFGDKNIARVFLSRASARGAACVSLEDKSFPKKNSFSEGVSLCEIPDFVEKLDACRKVLNPAKTALVARTDSLVAGEGIDRALERAHAYAATGVDGLIIHSKSKTVDELAEFMSRWDGDCPIIAIPTSFDDTAARRFDELGIACIIWANQLLRASIAAMETIAADMSAGKNVGSLKNQIVSVNTALSYADCRLGCSQV